MNQNPSNWLDGVCLLEHSVPATAVGTAANGVLKWRSMAALAAPAARQGCGGGAFDSNCMSLELMCCTRVNPVGRVAHNKCAVLEMGSIAEQHTCVGAQLRVVTTNVQCLGHLTLETHASDVVSL
jgi:hypothetical protein